MFITAKIAFIFTSLSEVHNSLFFFILFNNLTFTPEYQYAYSPYYSLYIFQGADKENLFNNEEFL